MKWIWFLGLSLAAWQDARKRQISVWLLLGLLIPGIGNLGMLWSWQDAGIWLYLAGTILAAAMLGLSKVTEGAIGEGDGLFFLVSACYMEIGKLLCLFLGTLGIGCVYGMILLVKKKREQTIPFLTCAWPMGLWILTW